MNTATGKRRGWPLALLVVLTLLGALALPSSSAAEESAPAFLFAFGGEGSSAGELKITRGVAVDESSGDVYVADQGNQRVEEFKPWGEFIRMFGGGVNHGVTTHPNECGAGEEQECGAGTAGTGAGAFKAPEGVAVDNAEGSESKGDVYVVDFENHRVEKFGPEGEFILAFGKEVDATTHENVCTAKDTCQAGKAGTGEDEFEWAVGSFIAVGSGGTVYVGDENRVQKFTPSGEYIEAIPLSPGLGKIKALAVAPSGDLYVGFVELPVVHSYDAKGEQLAEFNTGNTRVEALALNAAGDLFVGGAEPAGPYGIAEYSPSGTQLASFGTESLNGGSSTGIAANAGTLYVSEKTSPYRVLVFGNPPPGEPPSVPPSIDSQSVTDLGVREAVASAEIDPHFLKTEYYVEYGTDTTYSLGDVPEAPEKLGGGEVQSDQPASVTLPDLSPDTVYHYRFVAKNNKGETTKGPDQTFTTFSPPSILGLPDGRVYEQVSSQKKNGNEAGIELQSGTVLGGYGLATAGGERMVFFQIGPSGKTSSGTDLYSVSSRNPQTGWEVQAALPPGYGSNASNFKGEEPGAFMPSPDLSRFVFAASFSFAKGNPDAEESWGLYRAGLANPLEAEWWLTKPTEKPPEFESSPKPGHIKNNGPIPVGGSPSMGTVYFTYWGTLVPEDESRAPHVTSEAGTSTWGFYEWHEGTLKSAGELPEGNPPSAYGAVPAATTTTGELTPSVLSLHNEVSQDGSKAFFVSPEPKRAASGMPTELYVREQHESEGKPATTVLVSRNELEGGKAAVGSDNETAVTPVSGSYVYASPDGSRAFFESKDKLAKSSAEVEPGGSGPWTYEYDLTTNKLTYLPGVAGQILTTSEKGSSFIFENPATKKIELWSGGSAPVEIAQFSKPSSPKFPGARATSDGSAFVFATNAVLSPGSSGSFNNASAQNQIYRYEADTSHLTCISCAPLGTPQSPASPIIRGRAIADGGKRVFFGTAEQLLPQDKNGVEDAYEWEQEGTGSCPAGAAAGCTYLISSGTSSDPSFYVDNSESGDDVFVATRQGLAPTDTDGAYDIYDARVGGGFPEDAPSAGCTSGCQTPPPPAPIFGLPAGSALFPAGQNVPEALPKDAVQSSKTTKPKPLTRAQKLAKALKACMSKPRNRRAACKKEAYRKYGASAKAKKSRAKAKKSRATGKSSQRRAER